MNELQRNTYLENTVQTASPTQLLIMLCDGAVRFCKLAVEAMKQNKIEDANRNLVRVQNIIHELIITLDKKAPIAGQLLPLYDYILHRLIEANVHKKIDPAEEVLQHLIELRDTWVQAAKLANPTVSHAQSG